MLSLGNSLAWYKSWLLICTEFGMLRIFELVLFGYGVRIKKLKKSRAHFDVKFYIGWQPQ